jgi:uncharacterized repeat protein (TIGR01451 family)
VAVTLFAPAPAFGQAQILDVHEGLADFDARTGVVAPTAQQQAATSKLGAAAVWNRFGTVASLIRYRGYLATGMQGDEVTVARNFISANRGLFRLSDQGLANLELLNDQKMASGSGHAVLFRQRFGDLPAAQDGMITVGVVGDKVAYVSSSSAGDQAAPGAAKLTPLNAWLYAASDIKRTVSAANIKSLPAENGWTMFQVPGFSHPQRVRLVALPTPTSGVRSAYETIVLDVRGGNATAYTHFVDAQTGRVLFRQNRVNRLAESQIFQGSYQDAPAPPLCGPPHNYVVPAGKTSITVTASAAIVTNDIVLKLLFNGNQVAESDTATSPEAINYQPGGGVPAGTYTVLVCPFTPDPTVPPTPPYNYVGTFTTDDSPLPQAGIPYPPKWRAFPANPSLDLSDFDNRSLWCWVSEVSGAPVAGCDRELKNLAARGPWDYNFRTNTPTFTTIGNAAIAGEAWLSPLTPAEQYRPVSPMRNYDFPWTNSWKRNDCSQTAFSPDPVVGNRNDIDAATTNLFAMHNRMHDWSYFLGFTEENYNAQENNFGNRAAGGVVNNLTGGEFDPEVGNSQAGALTGGQPSLLGRDNANQISLQDGIPGITNMYLWQPIAAAFYSPCVDGDYDMAVIGHEYAHLITGRMVGGPDANPTGAQGGAMNESWSDQQAAEYLNEHGFVPTNDENPFAVGAYVTGNKETGIRNYGMNRNLKPPFDNGHQQNPLNYSNIGYDVTGPQVHADGEIWSATGYRIRQAFVEKYNGSFPASDAQLQLRCADGAYNTTGAPLDASVCPGNRRWIQIIYDAYLLQQADTSMITARNAYLAADMMRFGGANQDILWREFAHSGLGEFATTNTSDDPDPKPNFESAVEANEATITFDPRAFNERTHFNDASGAAAVAAKIYVGHYEARSTPIADSDPGTPLTATAKFVPGTYDFLVVAPGYGHFRFTETLTAGQTATRVVWMPTNYASIAKGAVASGDGVGQNLLIDDTEGTNWGSLGSPVAGKQVTVKLGSVSTQIGQPATNLHTVGRVQVSAMLRPVPAQGDPQDTGTQSRFAALRQFKIFTCTESLTNPNCVNPLGFTEIFTSSPEAFPGGLPRPNAPDLIIRSFDVPDTTATHVRIQVVTNQCTGQSEYFREDADLANTSDCRTSARANDVRIAELQVFDSPGGTGAPQDPVVTLTMTAPAKVAPGGFLNYELTYFNAGPAPSQGAQITSVLPAGVAFGTATDGGVYDPATRKVVWNLGTVPVLFSGKIRLTVRASPTTTLGTALINQATFTGELTVSPPTAVAMTLVAT